MIFMEKVLHVVFRKDVEIPECCKPKRIYNIFGETIDAMSVIDAFAERHPESAKRIDIYTTQLIILNKSLLLSGWRIFVIPFDKEKKEFEVEVGMVLANGEKLIAGDDILKLLVVGAFGDRIVCR